jgi:hypothetical protein
MSPLPTLRHVPPKDDHGFFSTLNVVTGFVTVKRYAKSIGHGKICAVSGNIITNNAPANNIAAQQIPH